MFIHFWKKNPTNMVVTSFLNIISKAFTASDGVIFIESVLKSPHYFRLWWNSNILSNLHEISANKGGSLLFYFLLHQRAQVAYSLTVVLAFIWPNLLFLISTGDPCRQYGCQAAIEILWIPSSVCLKFRKLWI